MTGKQIGTKLKLEGEVTTMSITPLPDDRIPVIVGVGEIVDRPKEITEGLEPLSLLAEALERAEADSGARLLNGIESLDIVNFLSWRYREPEQQLARRLGIQPKHAYYGPVGGESPIRYLHEAAQRIARGECSVAAVCGAEAQSTATKAERAGLSLPWTPFAQDVAEPKRGAAFQKPIAVKLGVFRPVSVYPFYEAATAAHWGQTPREAMAESSALWSRLFFSCFRKSQRLAEAAFCAAGDHDADAGQPADRMALHQTDGGQSHGQYGRRRPDDEPGEGARRRHP